MEILLDHGGPLLYWEQPAKKADLGGPRRGLEVDISICPGANCHLAHIEVGDAQQSDAAKEEAPQNSLLVSVHVDSGRIEAESPPPAGSPKAQLLERFEALLRQPNEGLLEVLRKRFRQARGTTLEAWRKLDWTWWEPGLLVFWESMFPDDPNLLFESNGERIWADDGYCIDAGCACREVTLAFTQADHEESEPLATISLDVKTGTVVDADNGTVPNEEQKRLWADIQEGVPELRKHLRRRQEELRRLAPEIRALTGKEPEPVKRNQALPGRNEPCLCGSGKKYKKCCMGREAPYEASDYRTKLAGD